MNNFVLKASLVFFAIFVIFCNAVQSQQSDEYDINDLFEKDIEELLNIKISVASTQPEELLHTMSSVSVISRNQIEKYNYASISEAVQTVAGFAVLRTYFMNNLATSRGILQDIYANKVLLIINNVPTWHAITGEGCLNRIHINDVERIEVLKGPASVLYGTNAYAGALNIILKDQNEKSTSVYGGVGSYSGYKFGGNGIYKPNKNFSIFATGHFQDQDGNTFDFTDELGETGQIQDYVRSANITLVADLKNRHSILINLYDIDRVNMGIIPRFTKGENNSFKLEGHLLNYKYSRLIYLANRDIDIKYSCTYDWNRRDFSRNLDDSIRADAFGYRVDNELKLNMPLKSKVEFEFGLNHNYRESEAYRIYIAETDSTTSHNNLKSRSVNEYSLFSQIRYERNPFNILLGTRITENELFGNDVSSRGSLVYSINYKNSLKFIIGQSFRSPSIFELYFTTSAQTIFGNLDLQPEKSISFEAVYMASTRAFSFQANAYLAKFKNKIYRIKKDLTLNDGTFLENVNMYENGNSFFGYGIETELNSQISDIGNAFLNFNYRTGNQGDQAEGSDYYNFKYTPSFLITTGVDKNIGQLTVSSLLNYRSKTPGPEENIDVTYTVDFNMRYAYRMKSHTVYAYFSIKNAFDTDVTIPEYVRRKGSNEIPLGNGRRFDFTIQVKF
ncbi:MAG: hypothetical protein B6244_08670 [Candidatus Cloacimonetes bacterium 4572_55]|nr:MAG: hypothetical protein B6244_08670 [Candidatus Cloacimonetes bacterium 4572_55]